MIKVLKIGLLALLFCVKVSLSVQSQVTIGSQSNPLKGVLLDLKESDEENGNANSDKGLILPRVILEAIDNLSPVLPETDPDYQNLKQGYTGLVVYNVSTNTPFERGIYVWDGSKWDPMKASRQIGSVLVENGLNVSNDGAIRLGGILNDNTTIDLNGNNLIFESNQGKIGVGTSNPKASLQIENPNNIEPLLLKNVRLVTDPKNEIDTKEPVYYNLSISENGVIRKSKSIANPNESFMYNLQSDTRIASGGTAGDGGSNLTWTKNGVQSNYITLPEDGLYVFSFCLYGSLDKASDNVYVKANPFYISAFKNKATTGNLMDIEEIVVMRTQDSNNASYYVNLAVSGNAGDNIYFKLSSGGNKFVWTLKANNSNLTDRTSMVFWKI